ncbi:MAG: rhodanese-like domain-containing protein [Candidatus Competibacteraceae bacterium]|nr:rhodanese-like domain-containing protein [Candidatus Competibacteraceae bacterium]MCB1807147.1 rhodanese-like domain-containing protein [Candidatus Competibacteraceae bacterium]
MQKRGFKQMMAEANAVIDTLSVHDALTLVDDPEVVFIDVREQSERQQTGAIKGAVHASRGFLEFKADPDSPMFEPAFTAKPRLVLYCASGGRSTLATKTLLDMGYTHVSHIAGGFAAWSAANGPIETVS